MHALLTLDVARDVVADQFRYDRPLAERAPAPVPAARAPRTRFALAGALHRIADTVAPAPCSPAR